MTILMFLVGSLWGLVAGLGIGRRLGRASVWTRFVKDQPYRRSALEQLADLEGARVELREM